MQKSAVSADICVGSNLSVALSQAVTIPDVVGASIADSVCPELFIFK